MQKNWGWRAITHCSCQNSLWWTERHNKLATAALMKNYCTRKKITNTIGLLKKEKKIPRNVFIGSGLLRSVVTQYNPNYGWIQSVFLENGLHLHWEMKLYNERWWRGTTQEKEKIDQDEKSYLHNMLREIIMCDYERKDYQRKDKNDEVIHKGLRGEEEHSYWPCSEFHVCIENLEHSGELGEWRAAFWQWQDLVGG